ncbi:hypothetical protein HYDPIDRAFT_110689 [Hydnomerulius pinastri MD-312]|nr:hypothetical protein HYDPIDRAFT_110689 [Hydnomerulius pinastri MD-312]
MDQDAFRDLLSTSRLPQASKKVTPTTTDNRTLKKAKSSGPAEPAFKPRKVKKADPHLQYRDRAAERRDGKGNDYAQVEAVLEDFEKRAALEDKEVVEQQRKYLGGDSEHTILVKGLDMSLLEQNRARAADATEDDDTLEQAFMEATSTPTATVAETKKRTREDIIRDLKAKRQNGDGDLAAESSANAARSAEEEKLALEAAKKAGKFKPIGFKPIGQKEEKAKKRKAKGADVKEGEKRKKRKVQSAPQESDIKAGAGEETRPALVEGLSSKVPEKLPEHEPASLDGDFDIFAGAGDYEGFPDDDESDGEIDESKLERSTSAAKDSQSSAPPIQATGGWFDDSEPEVRSLPTDTVARPSASKSPHRDIEMKPVEEEEEEVIRLKPLESSALPSIRDFLAMDDAAEKAEKRKARKEKKKKKKAGEDDDD